jgi:peptidoglycan hydrolase-like protein with peptidoglycan-binding domain
LFGDEIRAEGNSSGTSLKGRVQNLLRGGNPGSVVALEERHEQWFATDLELQIAALTARIAVLMKEIESAKTAHAGTTRDLYIGDEGEDVSRLQALLIERATGPMASELGRIGATGLFGEYTRAALAEFQAAAGILPSAGYFGPLTRAGIPDWEG